MFKKHLALILMLFGLVVLNSCSYLQKQFVQFRLARLKDSKARRVTYIPPPFPYKLGKSEKLDKLWRHTEDQSSISYFSSCSEINKDFSLDKIQEDILSEVPHWKIFKVRIIASLSLVPFSGYGRKL